MYDVEFSYKLPEWGNVELEATDTDEAETLAERYVKDTFPDAVDVMITSVREVKEDE
jgi:hypothetical protein